MSPPATSIIRILFLQSILISAVTSFALRAPAPASSSPFPTCSSSNSHQQQQYGYVHLNSKPVIKLPCSTMLSKRIQCPRCNVLVQVHSSKTTDEENDCPMTTSSTRRRATTKMILYLFGAIGICNSEILPNGNQVAYAADEGVGGWQQQQQQQQQQGNNKDAFASFGQSLNTMDFGGMYGGSDGVSIGNNIPQSGNSNNSGTENDKNLSDAIEEKKKKRSIDPRTHG